MITPAEKLPNDFVSEVFTDPEMMGMIEWFWTLKKFANSENLKIRIANKDCK